MSRRLIVPLLGIAMTVMTACSEEEPPTATAVPTVAPTPTATLSPQTTALPTVTLQAKAGEQFTFRLDSNRTTGYSWRLARPPDERLVTLVGSIYEPPATPLIGAGGREAWTFKAVAKGRTAIMLEYVRPFEPNSPPARVQTLDVVIE